MTEGSRVLHIMLDNLDTGTDCSLFTASAAVCHTKSVFVC